MTTTCISTFISTIRFNVMKDVNQFNRICKFVNDCYIMLHHCKDVITFIVRLHDTLHGMIELNGLKISDNTSLHQLNNDKYSFDYTDIIVSNVNLTSHELKIVDEKIDYIIDNIPINRVNKMKSTELVSLFNKLLHNYHTVLDICHEIIVKRMNGCYNGSYNIDYIQFHYLDRLDVDDTLLDNICNIYPNNHHYHNITHIVRWLIYKLSECDSDIIKVCNEHDKLHSNEKPCSITKLIIKNIK